MATELERGQQTPTGNHRVAVIVPCFNEEATIAEVVTDFKRQLPGAQLVILDNGSSDRTAQRANDAGARVLTEPRQGKGHAVRALLRQVEADLYLMVDGDSTYDPQAARKLIDAAHQSDIDLVLGTRATSEVNAYRLGHWSYNRLLEILIRLLFGRRIRDPLTGYRCLTRRFADHFPARSPGFTTEIEMDLFALEAGYGLAEVATHYRARPANSPSKLRSISDGTRILAVIALGAAGRLRFVYSAVALAAVSWFILGATSPEIPKLEPAAKVGLFALAAALAVAALSSWLRRSRLRRHPQV